MIRTVLISILVVVWLSLVYLGKKDRMQYVSKTLSVSEPDQVIGAKSSKLFFTGWSPPGGTDRGSNSKNPSVCFRPDPGSSLQSDRIIIAIDASFIEPLIGRKMRVHINDGSFDYQVASGHRHVLEYRFTNPVNGLVCVRFDLPLTLQLTWAFRGLGVLFSGLSYSYKKDLE